MQPSAMESVAYIVGLDDENIICMSCHRTSAATTGSCADADVISMLFYFAPAAACLNLHCTYDDDDDDEVALCRYENRAPLTIQLFKF